jgi:hypothetical protein
LKISAVGTHLADLSPLKVQVRLEGKDAFAASKQGEGKVRSKILTLILFIQLLGTAGFAEDSSKSAPPRKLPLPTAEQRKKMADAHEKMASCLRSTRTVEDCRHEMMEVCRGTTDQAACVVLGVG